jgi:hypothetical protein
MSWGPLLVNLVVRRGPGAQRVRAAAPAAGTS